MHKLKMFSLCIFNRHLTKIKALNYIPVGLGKDNFSNEWLRDNTNENISDKNRFYGEYTFHYWFWKNMINKVEKDTWIGFCGYRYFWKNNKNPYDQKFKNNILQDIPDEWEGYDSIIADPIKLDKIKFSKIIKNGGLSFLVDPKTYSSKKKNIKFHFDVFHGRGVLDKAIELLDDENRNDFKAYTRDNQSFHKWNMFICRSQELIKKYYQSIFPWLFKCENIFGLDLHGYAKTRIYGFLAERYLSYWFIKYGKSLSWPVFKHDIDKEEL